MVSSVSGIESLSDDRYFENELFSVFCVWFFLFALCIHLIDSYISYSSKEVTVVLFYETSSEECEHMNEILEILSPRREFRVSSSSMTLKIYYKLEMCFLILYV